MTGRVPLLHEKNGYKRKRNSHNNHTTNVGYIRITTVKLLCFFHIYFHDIRAYCYLFQLITPIFVGVEWTGNANKNPLPAYVVRRWGVECFMLCMGNFNFSLLQMQINFRNNINPIHTPAPRHSHPSIPLTGKYFYIRDMKSFIM